MEFECGRRRHVSLLKLPNEIDEQRLQLINAEEQSEQHTVKADFIS